MSDNFDSEPTGQETLRSRAWFLIAAGVLVLIVVLGVFVVVANLTDDDPSAAPPSSEPTSTTTPTDPDASVCGLPGHETEGTLATAPEGVTWTLVGRVAVPASKASGPGKTEESGLRYCYAHTPEGALLAAAGTYSWTEVLPRDPRGVVEHSIASGPGYDAALALAEEGSASATPADVVLFQIRGFRLLAYTGDSAMVDLAAQASTGTYVHQTFEMVWEQGDWRLRLAPDGSAPAAQPLPDLTGYIPWSGA